LTSFRESASFYDKFSREALVGKRGPQPVSKQYLEVTARNWASQLFALRDGQPGLLTKVVWNPWERREIRGTGKRVRLRSSRILQAQIIPVDKAIVRELAAKFKGSDWVLSQPVFPNPSLWDQFKGVRSPAAALKAVRRIRTWANKPNPPGAHWAWPGTLITIVTRQGREFLRAKRLPSYPRSNRPHSDDKRIEWFAKVLAGLEAGLAPATAVKRLGRVRFPKDEVARIRKEWEARMETEAQSTPPQQQGGKPQ
jgi:hypothetical protein